MLVIRIYSLRRGILYFTILPKFYQSEQTRDLPVYIHVNVHGGGVLGQAGHRHDAAADNDHKARTGAQTHLAHIQRVTLGRTRQLGVVAEGILRFGNADRQLAITQRGQLVQCLFCGGGVAYAVRAVDLRGDGSILSVSGASSS